MKKIVQTTLVGLLASLTVHAASFTLNGTAINNALAIDEDIGNTVVWLVNDGGVFDGSTFTSLDSDLSLATGGTLSSYEIAGSNAVIGGSGSEFIFGIGSITVTADAGDGFGLLVFDSSTTSTQAGDSFTIFTDASWVLPAAGASVTFGGDAQPNTLTSGGLAGTVVPEPSACALISGVLGLGWVMLRRRK